jgi:hypothetical protein
MNSVWFAYNQKKTLWKTFNLVVLCEFTAFSTAIFSQDFQGIVYYEYKKRYGWEGYFSDLKWFWEFEWKYDAKN